LSLPSTHPVWENSGQNERLRAKVAELEQALKEHRSGHRKAVATFQAHLAKCEKNGAKTAELQQRVGELQRALADPTRTRELEWHLVHEKTRATTEASALRGRIEDLRRVLLAFVKALDDDRADDEAFWGRIDHALANSRPVLRREYEIAKRRPEVS
jgi:chromosome segregation ATPase